MSSDVCNPLRRASATTLPGRAASVVPVAMATMAVSNNPREVLVSHALGSCVAVALYDPVQRVAGMIHLMLPSSSINPEKADARPAMFVDTGVPALFEAMYSAGCYKAGLWVKVCGGGRVLNTSASFDIGRRNYEMLTRLFELNDVSPAAVDVGGNVTRTARLYVADGLTTVTIRGTEVVL